VAIGNATALGNVNHIAIALLAKSVGGDVRKLKIVIFNSGAQSVQAALGGHVDLIVAPVGNLIPQARAGKLEILAIAAPKRFDGVLATVPTWNEMGADIVVSSVRMLLGSKGLAADHIAFWEKTMASLTETAEWKQFVDQVNGTPAYRGSRELSQFLNSEYARQRLILTELGLAK
jgi:putative tricarboxylic transport membrane protein